jgi:hypothetical protein
MSLKMVEPQGCCPPGFRVMKVRFELTSSRNSMRGFSLAKLLQSPGYLLGPKNTISEVEFSATNFIATI